MKVAIILAFVVLGVSCFPERRANNGCNSFCPMYIVQFCGSDGITYNSNECFLKSQWCKTYKEILKMQKHRDIDELRWYEIMLCCCKCRGECKACVTTMCMYYIPIILLFLLAGACVTIGAVWRTDCLYQPAVPYWVIVSSVTPFFLYSCIKGITQDYNGITCWRLVSFLDYLMFTAWVVLGSTWIFKTWANASDSNCNNVIRHFSFILVLVHWFFVLLSTIAQIIIMTKICCCCTENAINPLKRNIKLDGKALREHINLDGDNRIRPNQPR